MNMDEIMWNCTVNGDARSTDYGGYAAIFDNIVSFLLYHDRSASNYIDLINENREIFASSPNANLKRILVEPRELLSLMSQIELSHRLLWAPRPFKGSFSLMKDYLFRVENALVCVFCGSKSQLVRTASPPSVSQESAPAQVSEYFYERLDPFVCIPISTVANGEHHWPRLRITEPRYFHYHNCPLVWLSKNCRWNDDLFRWPLADPSKFYFAMQIVQYTGARCINTEVEWSEWVHRIKRTNVMGACELTLVRLFRKVIEMKLTSVDAHQLDIFQQLMYMFHYEESGIDRDATGKATNASQFLDNVLSGQEKVTLPSDESKLVCALNADCAWKAFVMHGFCVQKRTDPRVYYCEVNGNFSHVTTNMYTVTTTLELPTVEMMCVYCGMVFDGKLCDPESIERLYTKRNRRVILEYLLKSASFPLQKMKVFFTWDFWERSPSAENTKAFQVEEVLSSMELHDRIKQRNQDEPLSHQEKIMLWFSASLNLTHSPTCIFRYQKRIFSGEKCPICMDSLKTTRSLFNCGHTMCGRCINDIRVVACPVCKIGTRKQRLVVLRDQECLI